MMGKINYCIVSFIFFFRWFDTYKLLKSSGVTDSIRLEGVRTTWTSFFNRRSPSPSRRSGLFFSCTVTWFFSISSPFVVTEQEQDRTGRCVHYTSVHICMADAHTVSDTHTKRQTHTLTVTLQLQNKEETSPKEHLSYISNCTWQNL